MPGYAAGDDALLVDLQGATATDVAAFKQSAGASWWIEAGDTLLLAGNGEAMLRSTTLQRRQVRNLGRLSIDDLALHARGCDGATTPVDESLVVLRGASYDLVRRPQAFAPTGPVPASRLPRAAGPEWLPVEPNMTLSRLHRLDRPNGALPANDSIAAIVDQVDAARWFATVSTLTGWDRSSYSDELSLARQWIADEFAELGLTVAEPFFSFVYQGVQADVANVIGRIDGVQYPDEWIVVGGHYDSRNTINGATSPDDTPGADDNASGCSGVIEAARALVPYRPLRTIVFMCYSGEEQGLHGSQAHVGALGTAGDLDKINAMLNMDMIGWSPDATLGVTIGTLPGSANSQLSTLLADSALTYVPALDPDAVVTTASTCCSDHMPYLNAGRPATMSIHRGGTTYPHYHKSTDTPANLGPHAQDIGGAIVRMNVAALAQLAGTDRIFAADNESD